MIKRLEVHKFGGTSVGSAERIIKVAGLLIEAAQGARVVAVASAMAGVTDQLIKAADTAAAGRIDEARLAAVQIRERHTQALAIIDPDAPLVRDELVELTDRLMTTLEAVSRLRELTARTRDSILSMGEKLSCRLLAAALEIKRQPARAVDADQLIETDGKHGSANPLGIIADPGMRAALEPLTRRGVMPVVTGFCGRAPDGTTTTLGRGGSDLSATLLAAGLGADEVTIWTDVDGVFTADPRTVPDARVIDQLNFREAAELSFYGARVLHQRTMVPVVARGIPIRVRNSLRPDAVGTVVDAYSRPGSHPVKGISAVRSQALLSVEGKGMAGIPGVAARGFTALSQAGISVTMISMSSSEASLCLAVPRENARMAEAALKEVFRPDLSRGAIEEITVRSRVALVAVVGVGIAQAPRVAGRALGTLGHLGINILGIAQGSSKLNITIAVDEAEVDSALRAIHDAFGLSRIDTGQDSATGLDLIILGCGRVGEGLVELVMERRQHVLERFGLEVRIAALVDRSGALFRPAGIPPDELLAALRAKKAGEGVAHLPGGRRFGTTREMIQYVTQWRLTRPVLVDVSDSEDNGDGFVEAFERGCDVVTANKKPLAGSMAAFQRILETCRRTGRILKAEATVGAGLPVIDTLENLLASGDRLLRVEGCLSGTLGFVTARLEDKVSLSDAVTEAVERGYTEPDPIADLSGQDVARKALILGRLSGLVKSEQTVTLAPLVDPSLQGLPAAERQRRLEGLNRGMADRIARVGNDRCVLRYVARVEPERVAIGPEALPRDSTLGMLKGTDNMVAFFSERYKDRPLVVQGPGAGVHTTAMGVWADILRIAAERH